MDKNILFSVAKNLSADSPEVAAQVVASKNEFPYSQLLHVLSAKLSKEFSLPSQDEELRQAAIYVVDRSWLKEIMEMEFEHSVVKSSDQKVSVLAERKETILPAGPVAQTRIVKSETASVENVAQKDVAEALLKDLARLHELKHNFEMLFVDQDALTPIDADAAKLPDQTVKSEPTDVNENSRPTRGRKKRKDQPQENLIDEIQTTKSELEPESERQKQQIVIIDQFIKTQPSISGTKDRTQAQGSDLNSIKTGEFSDNIISETLVEILVKQGKKERAIEVLKKLIWKYPQKKAYFASQIEDLKK